MLFNYTEYTAQHYKLPTTDPLKSRKENMSYGEKK